MTRRGSPGWATVEAAAPDAPMAEQRNTDSSAQPTTVSDQELEDVVGGAAITIENQAQASNPIVFQKPSEPEEPLQSIAW